MYLCVSVCDLVYVCAFIVGYLCVCVSMCVCLCDYVCVCVLYVGIYVCVFL